MPINFTLNQFDFFSTVFLAMPKYFCTFAPENYGDKNVNRLYMYYVEKTMEISGSHYLRLSHESKCEALHGHNWIIKVYCKARELNEDGMVVDFTEIKRLVHGKLDHQDLNAVLPFNPSAENIAHWIVETVPNCYKASVQESSGNVAIYEKDED